MYKQGLMVKIRNVDVIKYIRGIENKSVVEIVENALRKKVGLPEKTDYRLSVRSKNKANVNAFPVKISDRKLIEYLVMLRKNHGITHRFWVENAILETSQIRSENNE